MQIDSSPISQAVSRGYFLKFPRLHVNHKLPRMQRKGGSLPGKVGLRWRRPVSKEGPLKFGPGKTPVSHIGYPKCTDNFLIGGVYTETYIV
jgi:hypothetical protein